MLLDHSEGLFNKMSVRLKTKKTLHVTQSYHSTSSPTITALHVCHSDLRGIPLLPQGLCTGCVVLLPLFPPNTCIFRSSYFSFLLPHNKLPQTKAHYLVVSVGQEFGHGLAGPSMEVSRLQPRYQWPVVLPGDPLGRTCFQAPISCCKIQLFAAIILRPRSPAGEGECRAARWEDTG